MKKIIHVNQHIIRKNKNYNENNPTITVKTYKSNNYTNNVKIICPCCNNEVMEVKQDMEKGLSCGARVWIEGKNVILLLDNGEYIE